MPKIQFPAEEVGDIVKSAITEVFQTVQDEWEKLLMDDWASSIEEKVLWNISKLNKPFKFIATCSMMQRTGGGLLSATSCFWDNTTDGSCTIRWENRDLYCIVTVFGLAI